jgi:epoxyqueuosine reductase
VRCKCGGGGFICPYQHRGGGSTFYNGVVTINSTQIKAQFDGDQVVALMQGWARELGFSQIGVAGVDLSSAEAGLLAWLSHGFHGEMGYMAHHGLKRARPAELVPGTVSVITTRMDYLPMDTVDGWADAELARLQRPQEGIVSLYARGRDYHKVLRNRLQKLADRLAAHMGPLGYRVFTDSAPVLEAELAARSGQGWRGKHTLLLNREAGSMFFLGEIYLDVALPTTPPSEAHCGSCSACISACPTQAIIAPHRLDARRCISYLTIEHDGAIPMEMRPLIGNRIYGCDDCQLVCPWNKFARRSSLPDFDAREGLAGETLATLLDWTEDTFLKHTEGSPIRRIGHVRWLRNVAVAMGNALRIAGLGDDERDTLVRSLQRRMHHSDPLVQEHVQWALQAFQHVSPD